MLSGVLQKVTMYKCLSQGSTLSAIIVRPKVLVWPVFEPEASRTGARALAIELKTDQWLLYCKGAVIIYGRCGG